MAKKLIILGAGESGVGAAILAKQQGFDVFVSDKGEIKEKYQKQLAELGVEYESGKHDEARILSADLVVKSPGIPDHVPLIVALHQNGIPVISEIEFASRYTDAKIIAITGSNGKTTSTMLTYHILKEAGYNVGLAGNVGDSFAKQVAEDINLSQSKTRHPYTHYVLEVSSFQLDGCVDFQPLVSVLLNITPDHLDRYDYKFENYVQSKLRIAQNQTANQVFIYWGDDVNITTHLEQIQAVKLPYCYGYDDPGFPLKGRHNELNANAALLAAMSVGISEDDCIKAINTFAPVKHRLQVVKKIEGVEYINDSKATNVDAVYYALDGMDKPIVWIAGGVDKGNDYSVLFPFLNKIKALVCLGKDNEKLKTVFNGKIEAIRETDGMESAVRMASSFASDGDVVLLSPACASFDLFNSYEHRGDEFIKAVESLAVSSASRNAQKAKSEEHEDWAKKFRRENRKNQTSAEATLWFALRNRKLSGKKFRRQHSIGKYIVDFVCIEHGLVVEVDGGYHNDVVVNQYDFQRDEWLGKQGFEVLRFDNDAVQNHLDSVLHAIELKLKNGDVT